MATLLLIVPVKNELIFLNSYFYFMLNKSRRFPRKLITDFSCQLRFLLLHYSVLILKVRKLFAFSSYFNIYFCSFSFFFLYFLTLFFVCFSFFVLFLIFSVLYFFIFIFLIDRFPCYSINLPIFSGNYIVLCLISHFIEFLFDLIFLNIWQLFY